MYSSVFHFFLLLSFLCFYLKLSSPSSTYSLSSFSVLQFANEHLKLAMNIFWETSWSIFRNTCITTNNKNYKLMSHMSDSVKQVLQRLKMATKSESDVTLTIKPFWGKLKLMSVAINFFLLFFRSHMSALILKDDQNLMLHQI